MHEITVEADLLESNERLARHNREHFEEHRLYVCNLMSGPGAGKTTLLERTLETLGSRFRFGVIEGDIQSSADADRIGRLGVPTVQINTGGACHLDSRMVHNHLSELNLEPLDVLVIENVGNLVCPAEFDLGEHDKLMLLSVTEGHDKPNKYPLMFHEARVLLLNKIDLLPHTDFDVERASHDARTLNKDLIIMPVSARTGEGLSAWFDWFANRIVEVRGSS